MVKLALPNGTINHFLERIKTSQKSWRGRTPSRYDEIRKPFDSGRMQRNCCKVFRKHLMEKSMIGHSHEASESWKKLPWKKFRRDLFRLQKRVFKAIQAGDKRKAMSLQKLILKSKAARLLAIHQVTQLNAGKKTAGIDGKKSLTFKERFELSELLKTSSNNWKHQRLRAIPIPKKDGSTRMLKIPTVCSYCTLNQDSLGIFCLTLLFPYGRAFYSNLKEQL